ncbi:unnamed protein product [Litomosoides sigmodontis]|uniref:Uncharacterized protein n=1 Tax=Litomosoides sigmodontis TaxID=42156 RepID=A0A3P6STZ8_LITSI|nr:unnamed protein product [Litomosoides sigmodontis]
MQRSHRIELIYQLAISLALKIDQNLGKRTSQRTIIMVTDSGNLWKDFVFYVDPVTNHQRPTFYFIWLVGSISIAVTTLPWYIYFIIRRSQIRSRAAINIKYTLLDFKKIHPGAKIEGWQEISIATSPHVNIKDEEVRKKYIAKVYRPSSSQCDTTSTTASEASSKTAKALCGSKRIQSAQMKSIINDDKTNYNGEPIHSITGSESITVPTNG